MRPLPAPCHWDHYPDNSCLMWHYGCVAVVYRDGRVVIQWGALPQINRRAASYKQGCRHVEQWVAAQRGLPPGKRALATRERVRAHLNL